MFTSRIHPVHKTPLLPSPLTCLLRLRVLHVPLTRRLRLFKSLQRHCSPHPKPIIPRTSSPTHNYTPLHRIPSRTPACMRTRTRITLDPCAPRVHTSPKIPSDYAFLDLFSNFNRRPSLACRLTLRCPIRQHSIVHALHARCAYLVLFVQASVVLMRMHSLHDRQLCPHTSAFIHSCLGSSLHASAIPCSFVCVLYTSCMPITCHV